MEKFEFVKITKRADGQVVEKPVWCLGRRFGIDVVTTCTHEVYGETIGVATWIKYNHIEYETKVATKGVTCPDCINVIKYFKSVKL